MRQRALVVLAVLCAAFLWGCAKEVDLNPQQYDRFEERPRQTNPLAENLYEAGLRAYRAGSCKQAVESWKKALTAGGAGWIYEDKVRYNIALCYVAMQRPTWAIAELERVVRIDPDFYDAHFTLANLYIRQERFPEAAEELTACTRLRGDDPSLFHTLGLSYLNAGKMPEAVSALSTAMFLDPSNEEMSDALFQAHRAWGARLYQAGEFEEALDKFAVAAEMRPGDGQTFYDMARCYVQLGRFEHAIETYRKAHELAPELAETERNLLARYARKSGKDAKFHLDLADVYASKGEWEKAAAEYENAIAANPDDYDRYLKLARFYAENLDDRQNAVRWYSAFLAANPNDPRVAMVRKEIARETAPAPDPDRKPELLWMRAGTGFDSAANEITGEQRGFPLGTRVYRAAAISNLWGMHSVVRRLIKPGGGVKYEENITQEFYVDQFTFVSVDTLNLKGTWRQEWIVDGVLLGTLKIKAR